MARGNRLLMLPPPSPPLLRPVHWVFPSTFAGLAFQVLHFRQMEKLNSPQAYLFRLPVCFYPECPVAC